MDISVAYLVPDVGNVQCVVEGGQSSPIWRPGVQQVDHHAHVNTDHLDERKRKTNQLSKHTKSFCESAKHLSE